MIADIFQQEFDKVLQQRLENPDQRELVVETVMQAFEAVPKRPVSNLQQRLNEMRGRLQRMVEQVKLGFVNGRLVVSVAGSSESLMGELRRGTDWYEPWEKVDQFVLGAILVDPPK